MVGLTWGPGAKRYGTAALEAESEAVLLWKPAYADGAKLVRWGLLAKL